MAPEIFRFERFRLDVGDRLISRDFVPVVLNARYLDALILLVREAGRLVSKNRFLEEVWGGVPVTDEALTQCIKTLRRQLGDDAARPRFIETVPKHGYRFIAAVTVDRVPEPRAMLLTEAIVEGRPFWLRFFLLGGAATAGGGIAGIFGGLFYGFSGAPPGIGAASMLVVLLCLNILVGLAGGAGVGFGIAAAGFVPGRAWKIAGGACGGLVVGALTKLLGLDAFNLLLGQSPGNITGAMEGALLGVAAGFGVWLGSRGGALIGRGVVAGSFAGGAVGLLIPLLGGRLMGGSLDLLARRFPESRLRLDRVGDVFGESGFGLISQAATGALEGALFGGCVVGAMLLAQRRLAPASSAMP